MTPKQALETLEGVEHHGSLGEAGDVLLAVIRRDWDMRVLDALAAQRVSSRAAEARKAAAQAAFPTLHEDDRDELGERP